jgi:hypothetical protein
MLSPDGAYDSDWLREARSSSLCSLLKDPTHPGGWSSHLGESYSNELSGVMMMLPTASHYVYGVLSL